MQYQVLKTFKGAIHGVHVREFVSGEVVEINDEDLAAVAEVNGWIAPAGAKAPKNKAMKSAPKAKDDATE